MGILTATFLRLWTNESFFWTQNHSFILKADRPHPRDYPPRPPDYRRARIDTHTNGRTDVQTDRRTDATNYMISLASRSIIKMNNATLMGISITVDWHWVVSDRSDLGSPESIVAKITKAVFFLSSWYVYDSDHCFVWHISLEASNSSLHSVSPPSILPKWMEP